ncbi:DUF7504 family protein [Haloarcula nitratireducens]|uniref:KaiC-like domain-containing protein n=1 Tax=Haloarcula nitratireducens TaxID=2487749 RepID=A0AAW4PBD4_9EURY|nr:hypothetical protein [Halomicroarcula nitratireducens]MBX0295194.1 hypothetical protein [Halomicroarcula nitratireducens]
MVSFSDQALSSVQPGDSILCLSPVFDTAGSRACTQLHAIEPPEQVAALLITYTQSPRAQLALYEQHLDRLPSKIEILHVGADRRPNTAPFTDTDTDEVPAEVAVRRVLSSTDLTSLGTLITNQLDDWKTTLRDRQIVVCFQSVTVFLQYNSLQETKRFLTEVIKRCADTAAVAHFHMDPKAHDEETIDALRPLFDVVLECGET